MLGQQPEVDEYQTLSVCPLCLEDRQARLPLEYSYEALTYICTFCGYVPESQSDAVAYNVIGRARDDGEHLAGRVQLSTGSGKEGTTTGVKIGVHGHTHTGSHSLDYRIRQQVSKFPVLCLLFYR